MIRLGLRLTLSGGKEAALRLVMIAVAVAIGVGLLLTTLASLNAVNSQNARYAWLETGYTGSHAPAATGATVGRPLWWQLRADYFQGKQIGRVDLAATGPDSPVPPGIGTLPGPGQFYASPALATLLRDAPDAELADRFPGTEIGTIGAPGLPAPNSLIIIVGRNVRDLAQSSDAEQVRAISTTVPSSCHSDCAFGVGIDSNGITLILSVVVAALLFPILIFIGGATRLSAARREQRFAAMRLIGATPGQISAISTVESSVAAVIGVALGFVLFFTLRPVLAAIPFTGAPFFIDDLSLSLPDVLSIALGIPIAAAVAARIALRRVSISPLGVSRRSTPRPPRAWRIVPLLAGLGELGYLAYFSHIGGAGKPVNTQVWAYLSGILLAIAGLTIAGPWLTMLGSRVMVRHANRPATLIAGRRLADNPQAGFRAVSGLVVAIFVGTCALAIITTIGADNGGVAGDTANSTGTLVREFGPGDPGAAITSIPPATTKALTSIPGVTGVAAIRTNLKGTEPPATQTKPGPGPVFSGPQQVIACTELAHTPAFGRCPAGADTVTIRADYEIGIIGKSSMSATTWPAADLTPTQLHSLQIAAIVVSTDGSTTALEQARTMLGAAYPSVYPAMTLTEDKARNNALTSSYQQLANVVILTSLLIAGCALAVSVAGGLADRKRPFSLLRLTGAPLAVLRRVVTLEAAAPLLVSTVVAASAGLLAAHLFLRAQLGETLQPPPVQYYVLILAGLVASLAVIASTLPLLTRITGPETARNE